MSNGLIWEGLGRALSQAGTTVGGYMAQDAKDQEAERLLALREEAAEKRQLALMDAKEAKEEASAKREGLIVVEAEKSAKKVGEDRNFEKFKNAFRADEQGYPEMEKWSDERIRAAYDEQRGGGKDPEYTDKYSTQRQDVLDEIRKMGGKSKTIESAQSDVKIAQAAEAAQAKDDRERRRQEAKDVKTEVDGKIAQQRADAASTIAAAALTRAEKAGSGGGGSNARDRTSEEERKRYTALLSDTTRELNSIDKAISEITKKPGKIKEGSQDFIDLTNLREQKQRAIDDRATYRKLLSGDAGSADAPAEKPASTVAQKDGQSTTGSTIKALPPGAVKVGTSGGKTVYEVNGKRYIQQ